MKTFVINTLRYWYPPWKNGTISLLLITFMVSVHLLTTTAEWTESWRDALGLQPGKIYTYLTYAMLHGDQGHLCENTILMFIFGPVVERKISRRFYGLATAVLIPLGALTSTILASNYWPTEYNPVGLSNLTFALITAGTYTLALKSMNNIPTTARNRWTALIFSVVVCSISIYGSFIVYGGPALVGHITAFSSGTAIAAIHAFLSNRKLGDPKPVLP